MRKIRAHYLINQKGVLLKNPEIGISENGLIASVFHGKPEVIEQANTEFYSGLIIPNLCIPTSDVDFLSIEANSAHQLKKMDDYLYSLGIGMMGVSDELATLNHKLSKISLATLNSNYLDLLNSDETNMMESLMIRHWQNYHLLDALYSLQEKLNINLISSVHRLFQLCNKIYENGIIDSIEIGNMAGLNLITGIDYEGMKITKNAGLRRLV